MLYTPSYGNSQLKMEILEFTSKEAAAPLMSLAASLWFWKFWKKILDFRFFFRNFDFFENFENYSIKHDLARSCFQLWPKIGDEGDKISRKKLARR